MIYFIYTYIIYIVYIKLYITYIYIYIWFIVDLLIKMVILHVFFWGKGVHNLATSGFIMIYLKIGFPE